MKIQEEIEKTIISGLKKKKLDMSKITEYTGLHECKNYMIMEGDGGFEYKNLTMAKQSLAQGEFTLVKKYTHRKQELCMLVKRSIQH